MKPVWVRCESTARVASTWFWGTARSSRESLSGKNTGRPPDERCTDSSVTRAPAASAIARTRRSRSGARMSPRPISRSSEGPDPFATRRRSVIFSRSRFCSSCGTTRK